VPDTNRTVTFHLRGGRVRVLPVANGVVVTPQAAVVSITVKGVDGVTRTIPAP
jgi:hypothetical protein